MPVHKYRVETDKGNFEVEVEEPGEPPNLNAVGGDTINGRDPNAPPGLLDRFKSSAIDVASRLAQPRSGMDLIGLVTGTSAPVATKLLPGAGPIIEKLGRGLERLGVATKGKRGLEAAAADILLRHASPIEGAAVATAPYAAEAAGKGAQAVGRALQRTEPLVRFGGPVERTLAETTPAVAESAAPVTAATSAARTLTAEERQAVDALVQQGYTESDVLAQLDTLKTPSGPKFTPAAVKLRMNAAETKQFLRLQKTGKTADEAAALVKAERELAKRLGTPDSETVRRKVQDRNATGKWED